MTSLTDDSSHPPLVSVVMPAYNAESYIAATLRSVLGQSYRHFEVLVVDDCSRDGTAEVVRALSAEDPRIRLIRLDKNFGAPAGPRNIGVRQARGRWVAFLDADDIWHPDKLKIQLDVLSRTGAKFCSSKMIDFRDERDLVFTPADDAQIARISFLSQLIKFRTPTSSVLVDLDVIRRHPFHESPSYKAREDLDCWLHCHEEIGTSVKIQHALIGYRLSPQQISGNKLKMVKRHYHVLKEYTFRSGRKLGIAAALFTFTHLVISSYYRVVLREL